MMNNASHIAGAFRLWFFKAGIKATRLGLLLVFAQCVLHAGENAQELKAKHVILLVIDGERYTETWGAPGREHIPRRSKELAPKGAMLTHCFNDGSTYTVPGHYALISGHSEEIKGNGTDLPPYPSLFQLLLSKGTPPEKAWFIGSKEKLQPLVDCSDPAFKGRYLANVDCGFGGLGEGNREDSVTMNKVHEVLLKHAPLFVAINLKDPDIAGHQRDWDGYLKGIHECDAMAADFWNWLQSQTEYAGKTALIITNDHGRHMNGRLEGFASHGDGCSGCRHIGFLALGPDFKTNVVINERHNQRDIAATLALLLNVSLYKSDGQPIQEIFEIARTSENSNPKK